MNTTSRDMSSLYRAVYKWTNKYDEDEVIFTGIIEAYSRSAASQIMLSLRDSVIAKFKEEQRVENYREVEISLGDVLMELVPLPEWIEAQLDKVNYLSDHSSSVE